MEKKLVYITLLIALLLVGCNKIKIFGNKGWNVQSETYYVDDSLKHVNNKACRVILLYGQSNATGCSQNWYLDDRDPSLYDEYDIGFSNVKINYVIEGNSYLTNHSFVDLKLSNTNVGATFGPEMGIGEEYSKYYPEDDVFIIKYTWGGSSLSNQWLTSKGKRNTMYYNAINFTKANLNYLISIGYDIKIEGICWMQGESDAFIGIWEKYYDNTVKLVDYFRNDLKQYQNSIKFIDAYIEDIDTWPKYKEINEQKLKFSSNDTNNYLIDTIALELRTDEEPYGTPDVAHYDSISMVELGREYAKIMINNE